LLKSTKAIKYRAVKIQRPFSAKFHNLSTIPELCGKPGALLLKTQAVGGFYKGKKVHKIRS
jgi:hypothetical protein